jgi:cardiolipin synthase (CMP-forming)
VEPAATRAGQPLRPLTLPNLIGYARLGLLVVFLAIALPSDDGRVAFATACFAVAAGMDYFDGLAARLTGQYSRLGALMDPFIDRALVLAGALVAWKFELLPRWALAVLAARELLMLIAVGVGLRKGLDIEINWIGRLSVWPTMSALGLTLIADTPVAEISLYVGLTGALAATVIYLRDGFVALRANRRSPPPAADRIGARAGMRSDGP